jgi:hypothetical protein
MLLSPLTAGKEFHCIFMTFGGRLKKGRVHGEAINLQEILWLWDSY